LNEGGEARLIRAAFSGVYGRVAIGAADLHEGSAVAVRRQSWNGRQGCVAARLRIGGKGLRRDFLEDEGFVIRLDGFSRRDDGPVGGDLLGGLRACVEVRVEGPGVAQLL
jgi:hypothetical protein